MQARVIERELRRPRQARAAALQPGTLEILAQAGVIEQVLAHSVQLDFARVFDAALRPVAETAFAGTGAGCPWEFQCSLPQWRTEQILADRLTELGGSVEGGVEAVSLDDTHDRVLVELKHADGAAERTEARWVIGPGGAHSVTRESMAGGVLAGQTYPGTALVADVAVSCNLPRDGSALIASPAGYVLLAPLPDERWLTFAGDLDDDEIGRLTSDTSIDAVAATLRRRVASAVQLSDVGWAATFRMHRRMAPHLADGRRFLLGDAGHLSSPFGGEGLNSGLHDGHNLAWKLSPELKGRARPSLLDTFAIERGAAAQHVLAVSDRLHALAQGAVEPARTGVWPAPPSGEQTAALVRSRSMLDVSYADSPLTGEYLPSGRPERASPAPGERYPDRAALTGTAHHLLVFGNADSDGMQRLRHRWAGLIDIAKAAGDPSRAGLAAPGGGLAGPAAVLVRPDGQVGFRAIPADSAGLAALDAHLSSYLIPG